MTAIGRIIAFGALLAGCLGCGDRFQFVGKWRGMNNQAVAPGVPEDVANSVRAVHLSIDANGRFDLYAGGISLAGAAHTSGNEATLEPDTYMGFPLSQQAKEIRDVDRTARLKGNPDGTLTFLQGQLDPVTLKRESQPGG